MKYAPVLALSLLFPGVLFAADQIELIQIYGSLRPETIARSPEGGDLVRRMDDGYSRIGIKGETELSDALTGFYKYERRVSANDGEDDGAVRGDHNELRQVHAGVRGAFGAVSMGRHYGLYYDYIDDELDRHRSHYSDAIVFSDLFVSNALVYSSPELGAFNFGALIEFNDADAQGDAVDERFEVAGTFRHQALAVHAGYVKSPVHDGLFGLAASYQHGSFKLAGVYQQRIDAHKLYSIALDAALNDHNKARVSLTINDAEPSEVYLIAGADHVFSGHFLAFAELFRRSSDVAQASDESALVFGFRFDF